MPRSRWRGGIGAFGALVRLALTSPASALGGTILRFSYENRPVPIDLVSPSYISLLSDTHYTGMRWSSFGGPQAEGPATLVTGTIGGSGSAIGFTAG